MPTYIFNGFYFETDADGQSIDFALTTVGITTRAGVRARQHRRRALFCAYSAALRLGSTQSARGKWQV